MYLRYSKLFVYLRPEILARIISAALKLLLNTKKTFNEKNVSAFKTQASQQARL